MRDLNLLNVYRQHGETINQILGGWPGDGTCGVFLIPTLGRPLKVIASTGEDWDHVSVSVTDRCPTWDEMEKVKRLFFKDDETAMQLHVPPSEHINCHPHCLHLWRPQNAVIPRPPRILVGAG